MTISYLHSIHKDIISAIHTAAGNVKAGNENNARGVLNGAQQYFFQHETQCMLEIINATRTAPAADSERNNPKRQAVQAKLPQKVQTQWDILTACPGSNADEGFRFNRAKAASLRSLVSFLENCIPFEPKKEALTFLEVQDLSALACSSTTLHYQLTHQMPRVWQVVSRTFTVIQWPDFSKLQPRATKLAVIDTFEKIQLANRTLEELCGVTYAPLLRPIGKLSGFSAQDLKSKITNPRDRFLNHTHKVIRAIVEKSKPREAYLPNLLKPLKEKAPNRAQDLLNLLFICGEHANPHMLGAFINNCQYGEVRTGAIRSIVVNGTLPDTASVDSLIDEYSRAPSAQWITECIRHLLARGYKPNHQNLERYTWWIPDAPLSLLKDLIQAAPEVDASPLAPMLVILFTSMNYGHKRKDRPEDIAKALSWFKRREDWTSIPNTAWSFIEAAKTQHPQLMQALIDLGIKPDNSSTPTNTLSRAIQDKLPLEVISLLCCYNAQPCEKTFGLVDQYSQDAEMQRILRGMLFAQQALL